MIPIATQRSAARLLLGHIVLVMLVAVAPIASRVSAAQDRPAPAAQGTPEAPWPPIGVVRMGPGIKHPRLLREVKPNYTRDAMREKVQGSVSLEAVVQADGTVGEVRVTRSLDREFGLDDEAVACVKKWRFSPGTKDGEAVPVLVEIEMSFTLKK